nr:hypothetical protein Q903MT_gene5975 [Picea sitchensis]
MPNSIYQVRFIASDQTHCFASAQNLNVRALNSPSLRLMSLASPPYLSMEIEPIQVK